MMIPNSRPQPKPLGEGLLVTKAREQFGEQSGLASSSVRALALAIIAVAWLFLMGKSSDPSSALQIAKKEHLLTAALLAGVLSLVLDAAQYGLTAWLWSRYTHVLEQLTSSRGLTSASEATWRRANGINLLKYVLDETGQNTPELRSNRDLSIAKVKELLTDYPQPITGDEVDAQAKATLQEKVWAAFNRPEAPKSGQRANRIIFWLKILAVIGGGLCLATFIVVRIWFADSVSDPITPEQSKAQVIDAATDVSSAIGLPVASATFSRVSCNAEGDAPFRGVVNIDYRPPTDPAAAAAAFAQMKQRLLTAGWTADDNFEGNRSALMKNGVHAVLSPADITVANVQVTLYGECRDVTTRAQTKTD